MFANGWSSLLFKHLSQGEDSWTAYWPLGIPKHINHSQNPAPMHIGSSFGLFWVIWDLFWIGKYAIMDGAQPVNQMAQLVLPRDFGVPHFAGCCLCVAFHAVVFLLGGFKSPSLSKKNVCLPLEQPWCSHFTDFVSFCDVKCAILYQIYAPWC